MDGQGTVRTRVGRRGDADGGPAVVELDGGDGGFRAAIGEYPDGAGRLNLWDGDGRPIVGRTP